MGYTSLKSVVDADIKTNGRQEITGAKLNNVLTDILKGVDLLERQRGVDTTGMGFLALSKDKTLEEQVVNDNTIYEIRDTFTISADTTIPSGCILHFNGGKIVGGGHTLTFSRSIISGNARFENCEFAGTILNGEVKISWFTDGMSDTSDYSVDHSQRLISAMKLTSLIRNGWLDMERIPICVKQTILITDAFGNIGIRGGNIYFVSSTSKQALFDYQQSASYKGNYSPIVDCIFTDVGDNYDTCVIKKTSWSDTLFTYWKNIKVFGFTGYFFVTNSYVQECTFDNISVDGAGMFTTNSDNLYTGGYGSGNILNFLNCNINNGQSDSKTTIRALYDMSNVIEATIHNAVLQGRIGGSNIYPLYIGHPASDAKRTTIVLDGFWVEYVTSNVLRRIKVENTSAWIAVKRNAPVGFDVVNSNLTIRDEQSGGLSSRELIDNLDIDSDSNVTLIIDTAGYQLDFIAANSYPNFQRLVDEGILRICQNSTPPYGSNVSQTGVSIALRPVNEADMMREYIQSKITGLKVSGRGTYHKLGVSNGVPTLVFEATESATYYDFSFINHFERILGGGYSRTMSRGLWVDVIYRATILVDVTSANLSEVSCRGRGFLNVGGSAYADFITPSVGMQAGETTGWRRMGRCSIWALSAFTTAGMNLEMRNTKLEFAKIRIARRNVDLSEDVFIDGNGDLQRTDKTTRIYHIPITAANETMANMSAIINDCPATIETDRNIYKYTNGAVHAIFDYRRKSGTTAQRPALSSSDAGWVYYDTSLSKAIIWNGSAWVNMDGSAL